jgi:hypothetical protein
MNSFIANIERPGTGYCKRRLCRSGGTSTLAEPLVEISSDRGHQRLDLAVEEMVGAGKDLLLDDDARGGAIRLWQSEAAFKVAALGDW